MPSWALQGEGYLGSGASATPTPTSFHSISPPPPLPPGSGGPHAGLQGCNSDPHAEPSIGELSGGREESQIQSSVILRPECQLPRANSAGGGQSGWASWRRQQVPPLWLSESYSLAMCPIGVTDAKKSSLEPDI